jgi:hypothetical protein
MEIGEDLWKQRYQTPECIGLRGANSGSRLDVKALNQPIPTYWATSDSRRPYISPPRGRGFGVFLYRETSKG